MFDLPPPPPPMYEVVRWAPIIQEEIAKTPLAHDDLTMAEMFAFLDLESDGDAWAHRPGSQYESLMQIGSSSIREIHKWSKRIEWSGDLATLIVDKKGKPNQRTLRGDGRLSIRAWLVVYWVYRRRHEHDTVLKGVFWKAGPGTLATYKKLYDKRGRARADRFLRSLHHRGIPRGVEYVVRLERLRDKYQEYVDHLNAPYRVCSPQLVDPNAFTVMSPNIETRNKRHKLSI